MGEVEYIIDSLEVKYEGVSNIEEFYEFVRSSLESLGYGLTEKEHIEEGTKKFSIKCKAEKPVDDYTMFIIKTGVAASYEHVEVKNKKMQKGVFKLKMKAIIGRDYQDRWDGPVSRLLRGIYDKYIAIGKKKNHEADLKEDVYTVAEKAKKYFGMHKL